MPNKKDIASDVAGLADAYWSKREERLAIDRQSKVLKAEEDTYKEHLLIAMGKHELSAVGGELCRVERNRVAKPTVGDWNEFYQYVRDHDAFDMLYRRLNERAIKDRLEDGENISGLVQVWVDTLSVHKVK
jgi:hypothetical protein